MTSTYRRVHTSEGETLLLADADLGQWRQSASLSASDQGSITAVTDVTGGSLQWDALPRRRYKYTAWVYISNTAAANGEELQITDTSNNIKVTARVVSSAAASTKGDLLQIIWEETGIASGLVTRKLRVLAAAGTSTIRNSFQPGYFLVEDMGNQA